MNKYRIKTKILPEQNQYLKVNINQDFDALDILTLSIYGTDVYPNPCGDWGVVIGRVVDRNSFPMENVKIGYIIPIDEDDSNDITIKTIYNNIVNSDYPLLPNYRVNKNHYPVGAFPSEDEVLSNTALEYVYKKYFKHITSTNQNGDYVLMGLPLGQGRIIMNFDSTDAGSLSTTPTQQIATKQKNSDDFKKDQNINKTNLSANGGYVVTATTIGSVMTLGTINTSSTDGGGRALVITGATADDFGGGASLKNQNGDTISVVQKLLPNDNSVGGGTLIGRGTNIFVKSFFGDVDQCEVGINRYDYKLDYSYQPCNYIIGSFYSDYNIFNSKTPTYRINNVAFASSKQNMGGRVAFLLDSSSENEPDIFADVAPDGTFYAAIPCKWDRYNIDEEGNWYKTNDDFSENPTGIFTKTPYCLMMYVNNNVSVNIADGKTYSRASAIGFNLNNNSDFVEQIGIDGSLGLRTINRFGINYNAQYYFASPFPNGYYNPIKTEYYDFKNENNGTKYRNGAELNWDYSNRRSNVYTIATQWTKYGYYSALNVENNGLLSFKDDDILGRSRYVPTPNLYTTKEISETNITNNEIIVNLTTKGLSYPGEQLPLDNIIIDNQVYSGDLNTLDYPSGKIGNSNFPDFNFTNNKPDIGVWTNDGGNTNSVLEVRKDGVFNIKGDINFIGVIDNGNVPYNKVIEIIVNRNGSNIILKRYVNGTIPPRPSGGSTQGNVTARVNNSNPNKFSINYSNYFKIGDLIYFKFYTELALNRKNMRLENVNINISYSNYGFVYPLIVGNMYLPTFEATKYDTIYYPVGGVTEIIDSNDGVGNALKLSEVDVMLYPITDEIMDIVEHSQITNPYESDTINYYFFCNQFWKLRDFIYNEIK